MLKLRWARKAQSSKLKAQSSKQIVKLSVRRLLRKLSGRDYEKIQVASRDAEGRRTMQRYKPVWIETTNRWRMSLTAWFGGLCGNVKPNIFTRNGSWFFQFLPIQMDAFDCCRGSDRSGEQRLSPFWISEIRIRINQGVLTHTSY